MTISRQALEVIIQEKAGRGKQASRKMWDIFGIMWDKMSFLWVMGGI
jgi:hypothetical protein